MHDNATNVERITINVAGKYLIIGQVRFATNGTGIRIIGIIKNAGGDSVAAMSIPPNATSETTLTVSGLDDLTVGEYLVLQVYQTSGGNLDIIGGAEGYKTMFMVIKQN